MRFAQHATFDHPITTLNMKSYQPSQSGRGSRRGSRNRGDGRSGRGNSERQGNGAKAPALTLWQKITAFFTGSKPASKKEAFSAPTRPPSAGERSEDRPKPPAPSETPRTSRKPEAVEVTSPRLYVGNLSFDATESDLTELFNGVGQVVSVEVVSHRQTQRSKGFAFVQMQTVDEAKRAVQELHDKEFMSRKLVVSGAKNVDQADDRSEPRFAA